MLIRQPSMAGGEISPTLSGRSDLAKYLSSLATCRNCIVTSHGIVVNRPGSKFVAETKTSAKKSRLVPFNFGSDQNFVLEFGDQYIRFYQNGGQVLDTGVPYEVATPYLEADLFKLKFSQAGDIITITHRGYAPRELRRFGNINWTLTEVGFWGDPLPANMTDMALVSTAAEGGAGSITAVFAITAVYSDGRESLPRISPLVSYPTTNNVSARVGATAASAPVSYNVYRAIVDSSNVNTPLLSFDFIGEITPAKAGTIPGYSFLGNVMALPADDTKHPPMYMNPFAGPPVAWGAGAFYKVGQRVVANGNTYECIWPGRSSTAGTGPSVTAGIVRDGPAYRVSGAAYAVNDLFEIFGMLATVTTAGSAAASTHNVSWGIGGPWTDGTLQYTVGGADTDLRGAVYWKFVQVGTAPSTWPETSAIFDQRKWYANTTEQPSSLWASRVGAYNDFDIDTPLVDDSPLHELRLDAVLYEEIKWLLPLRALLAGTTEAPWMISGAGGAVDAVTALSKRARPQSYVGSGDLPPVKIGHALLSVTPLGNEVHDFVYDVQADAYRSNDISIFARHLFESHSIVDWVWATYPHSVAWAVREDGTLLGVTYKREHEIVAWHRHDTAGLYESVASVREGGEQAVYVIVNRTVNGVTKRFVERFASRILPRVNGVVDVQRCVFLDSSISYDGVPATVFSGLGHLTGEDVTVLADGAVAGPYTVVGGQIDISTDFPDGASVVIAGLSYDSDIGLLDATSQQAEIHKRLKRVISVMFEVVESRGMKVGVSFAAADLRDARPRTVAGGYASMEAYTGEVVVRIPSNHDRKGRAVLRQSDPLPMTLVGITREVELGDD